LPELGEVAWLSPGLPWSGDRLGRTGRYRECQANVCVGLREAAPLDLGGGRLIPPFILHAFERWRSAAQAGTVRVSPADATGINQREPPLTGRHDMRARNVSLWITGGVVVTMMASGSALAQGTHDEQQHGTETKPKAQARPEVGSGHIPAHGPARTPAPAGKRTSPPAPSAPQPAQRRLGR